MEELSIGDFAKATRLSPKALRLYDELGLLWPARVDASTGYRFYRPNQLDRARLVAALRTLRMPLAEIRVLLDMEAADAAVFLGSYWAKAQQDHDAASHLVTLLVDQLNGRRAVMPDVITTTMPERHVLTLHRRVGSSQEVWELGKEFIGIMRDRPMPRVEGQPGALFLVYYGEVSDDSDGPVEFCCPVPSEGSATLTEQYPELKARIEPAHEEAQIALGQGPEIPNSRWTVVSEALRSWAIEHQRMQSDLGVRLIYEHTSKAAAGPVEPDITFAVPLEGDRWTGDTLAESAHWSMDRIDHWIGGKRVEGGGGRRGPVYNPARGEQTAEVAMADRAVVDQAMDVASMAAAEWAATSLSARAAVMFRFRELLDQQRGELAALVTAEHGKVLSDAAGEVARGVENVEFACGIPHLMKGAHSTEVSTGVDVHTVLEPLGVVVGITPFNFPVMVPLWMAANALATGNAFVLKPSEKDPSPSLLLAELLQQAGVPDGVFTILQGDAETVDALLAHPDVSAVSFVGSTPVARSIYETATRKSKRVQALGGAKNHMVVLPDADVDAAADAAVSAGFGSAGERCMAISVVVAVGGVADALVQGIADRIPAVTIGAGTDPASQMGPLISAAHRDRVRSYVDGAAGEGAVVAVDGRGEWAERPGFFLGCTLLDRVGPGMAAYEDEIFGPVLSVVRVDTYEDAVALINANPYGNGTAIFTRDGGAARRFQRDVTVGMVGINVAIPVPVGFHSFGGWKSSLFGDSSMYGPEGVRFYTRPKVVTTRWPDPATSVVDLGFPQTR